MMEMKGDVNRALLMNYKGFYSGFTVKLSYLCTTNRYTKLRSTNTTKEYFIYIFFVLKFT